MVASSIIILLGLCRTCGASGELRLSFWLGGLGLVLGLLALFGRLLPQQFRRLEDASFVVAGIAAPVLISAMLQHGLCWPCVVFWGAAAGHVVFSLLARPGTSPWILAPAVVASMAVFLLRFDPLGSAELDAYLYRIKPPKEEPQLYTAGWEMHQNLVLPDRSMNVVWTNCAPCVSGPALEAYRRLKRDHPDARFLVANGAQHLVPPEEKETWGLAMPDFVEGLGATPEGPSIFVQLEGHKVVRIGYLTDYR